MSTGLAEAAAAGRGRIDALQRTENGRLLLHAALVAVLAAAYYLAGRIGLELLIDGAVSAFWPPVGVGIAALALYGLRLAPGVVIGDLLLADASQSDVAVLGQTIGNTIAVVAAAALLRRLTAGRLALDRVRDVSAFVVCALVAAAVSAMFGPPALRIGGVIEPGELLTSFRTWFLSDLSGALVVTPLLLTWATMRTVGFGRRSAIEAVATLGVLVLLAEIPSQRDVPYVVFPVLLWAALRFGPRGAATAVAVVTIHTVWNTAQDAGPFVRDSVDDSRLASQLFIAVSALTSLVLAAATSEREGADDEVAELAEEQAALRRVATLVARETRPRHVFDRVTGEVGRLLGAPSVSVVRFDNDGSARVVGSTSEIGTPHLRVGTKVAMDGDTVIARVRRSGAPERVDSYDAATGTLADTLRSLGYRSAVAAPVKLGGRLWGAIVAATVRDEPLPEGSERRLCDFAELVAQALANADALEKLAASRARIIEAGDAERRRLERNLHDGAQQRLVSLALHLRRVAATLETDPRAAREILDGANEELHRALEELRELARGIHPAILTDRGLGPAIEALATRAPVPVEIAELPDERLPEAAEAAAYYVVAEAITNVAKYADASAVTVSVTRSDGRAFVSVADDGVGGADSSKGSGLSGLVDRIEALGGHLEVESPKNGGTRIRAEIPTA